MEMLLQQMTKDDQFWFAFRLYSYVGATGVLVVVAQVVFVCCIIYFLLALSRRLKREGWRFIRSFWNLIDVASFALSIVCVVLYILQNIATTNAISKIKKLKGKLKLKNSLPYFDKS